MAIVVEGIRIIGRRKRTSTSEDFVLASGRDEWICKHNKKDGDGITLLLTINCTTCIYYLLSLKKI